MSEYLIINNFEETQLTGFLFYLISYKFNTTKNASNLKGILFIVDLFIKFPRQ